MLPTGFSSKINRITSLENKTGYVKEFLFVCFILHIVRTLTLSLQKNNTNQVRKDFCFNLGFPLQSQNTYLCRVKECLKQM